MKHARKLCELDGRKSWMYVLTLAIAEAEAGNFEKAQEELDAALQNSPKRRGRSIRICATGLAGGRHSRANEKSGGDEPRRSR